MTKMEQALPARFSKIYLVSGTYDPKWSQQLIFMVRYPFWARSLIVHLTKKCTWLTQRLEIFESNFLKPQPALEFAYMEVLINTGTVKVEDQVTYLYK